MTLILRAQVGITAVSNLHVHVTNLDRDLRNNPSTMVAGDIFHVMLKTSMRVEYKDIVFLVRHLEGD